MQTTQTHALDTNTNATKNWDAACRASPCARGSGCRVPAHLWHGLHKAARNEVDAKVKHVCLQQRRGDVRALRNQRQTHTHTPGIMRERWEKGRVQGPGGTFQRSTQSTADGAQVPHQHSPSSTLGCARVGSTSNFPRDDFTRLGEQHGHLHRNHLWDAGGIHNHDGFAREPTQSRVVSALKATFHHHPAVHLP